MESKQNELDIESKIENVFKLPIQYKKHHILNKSLLEDLELCNENIISCLNNKPFLLEDFYT